MAFAGSVPLSDSGAQNLKGSPAMWPSLPSHRTPPGSEPAPADTTSQWRRKAGLPGAPNDSCLLFETPRESLRGSRKEHPMQKRKRKPSHSGTPEERIILRQTKQAMARPEGIEDRFIQLEHRGLTESLVLDFFQKEEEQAKGLVARGISQSEVERQCCRFAHHLHCLYPDGGPVLEEISRRYPDEPYIFQMARNHERLREKIAATVTLSPQVTQQCRIILQEALDNPKTVSVQTSDGVLDYIDFQEGKVTSRQRRHLGNLIFTAVKMDGLMIAQGLSENPDEVEAFGFHFLNQRFIPVEESYLRTLVEETYWSAF